MVRDALPGLDRARERYAMAMQAERDGKRALMRSYLLHARFLYVLCGVKAGVAECNRLLAQWEDQ